MQARSHYLDISGDQLRERIKALGLTYAAAAERLGLTRDGLNKQMRGDRPVSHQTVIILCTLERQHRTRRNTAKASD
jgi:transcriptional regulator with XRE-family HTH domain